MCSEIFANHFCFVDLNSEHNAVVSKRKKKNGKTFKNIALLGTYLDKDRASMGQT